MKKLETLIFKTVLLTLFVFPFWNALGYILFGGSCVFSLFFLLKNGTKILDTNILFQICLGLFFLYFCNEILFGSLFENFHFGFWLGVPLVFCSFRFTELRKKQLLIALNLGGFVMILITFILAFLEQKLGFAENILRQHRTIYGYFLCINFITSIKLSEFKTPIFLKIIFEMNAIFSIFLLFVIGSRMPLIIYFLILISFVLRFIFIRKNKKTFLKINVWMLISLLFLLVFSIFFGNDFKNPENKIKNNHRNLKATFDKKQNERIYIYKAVFDIFKNENFHFLTGYHTHLKSRNILKLHLKEQNKFLQKAGYNISLDTNFRTHNDFLEHFLNYGILGVLLFFSFFVVLFRKAFLQKKFDLYACGILLFFACLTDNAFLMQASLFIFISLSVLLFRNFDFDAKTNKK